MPETTPNHQPTRAQQLHGIVQECIRLRMNGQFVSDDSLIQQHPDLMPDLARMLKELARVQLAREKAATPPSPTVFRDISAGPPPAAAETLPPGSPPLSSSQTPPPNATTPPPDFPLPLPLPLAAPSPSPASASSPDVAVSESPDGSPVPGSTWAGDFLIIDRIGHGGMGEVWRAVQLSTRREVALKLLRSGSFASARARQRFEREVEIAANLEHPNIARVYASGEHHGLLYYAMELVEGQPLDAYIQFHSPSRPDILRLMRLVCLAVEHAHQRGVIHRDLKPGNILVTDDGQPKLLDFGLAKALDEAGFELTVSVDGEILGTPAYMSPEQARGDSRHIDTRTDVYSLGIVLYELLIGRRPFEDSANYLESLQRVATEEPRRPRAVDPTLDREVEAILLKALAHELPHRYQSAGALADDIHRYLRGEMLLARPHTTRYFLEKRLRKYRLQVSLVAALLIATIAATLYHIHSLNVAWKSEVVARLGEEHQRKIAEHRWEFAMGTLRDLAGAVHRELSTSPALRARLNDLALRHLAMLIEDPANADPDASRTLAQALATQGDVFLALGSPDAARQAYDHAINRLQRLAQRFPEEPRPQRDLAVVLAKAAHLHLLAGRPADAESRLAQAKALLQPQVNPAISRPEIVHNYIQLLLLSGNIRLDNADAPAALAAFESALSTLQQQPPASANPEFAHDPILCRERLATAHLRLAAIQPPAPHLARARTLLNESLPLARDLAQRNPKDPQSRHPLLLVLSRIAETALKAGAPAEARSLADQALALAQSLTADDPARPDFHHDLASAWYLQGELALAEGNHPRARESFDKTLAILNASPATENAQSPATRRLLAAAQRQCSALAPSTRPTTQPNPAPVRPSAQ